MIVSRIFAVISAALLVGSVALALLGPPNLPLAHGLFMLDHDALTRLQGLQQHMPAWLWTWLMAPVLSRPDWLLPAALGLICAGVSATFAARPAAPHKKRGWRS